jgi:hypothetical protein
MQDAACAVHAQQRFSPIRRLARPLLMAIVASVVWIALALTWVFHAVMLVRHVDPAELPPRARWRLGLPETDYQPPDDRADRLDEDEDENLGALAHGRGLPRRHRAAEGRRDLGGGRATLVVLPGARS